MTKQRDAKYARLVISVLDAAIAYFVIYRWLDAPGWAALIAYWNLRALSLIVQVADALTAQKKTLAQLVALDAFTRSLRERVKL